MSPASGGIAGGTRVTIRGTNLSSAIAVGFGPRGRQLTVVSDTELQVTTRPAAGIVDVTVLTPIATSPRAGTVERSPCVTSTVLGLRERRRRGPEVRGQLRASAP